MRKREVKEPWKRILGWGRQVEGMSAPAGLLIALVWGLSIRLLAFYVALHCFGDEGYHGPKDEVCYSAFPILHLDTQLQLNLHCIALLSTALLFWSRCPRVVLTCSLYMYSIALHTQLDDNWRRERLDAFSTVIPE